MSFPVFKDFDKSTRDIFGEDFDSKYSLKVKSAGPFSTVVTTNTTFETAKDGSRSASAKTSLKWNHASGFTLEKFEVDPKCSMVIETSLVGAAVAPGLKLEFKGNDRNDDKAKADLSATYVTPVATFTGEIDLSSFSSIKSSICAGHGPITAGASLDVKIGKSKIDSTSFGCGVSYSIPKLLFVGARAEKSGASYSALASFVTQPDVTVASSVDYTVKGGSLAGSIGTVYKFAPDTTIKAKVTSAGVFSASLKQSFEKKFSVIASTEVAKSLDSIKFGVNATLG